MLDIKFIRENVELVKKGAELKRIKVDIDRLLEVDSGIRPLQQDLEKLQAERNQLSKLIPKCSSREERQVQVTKVGEIKKQIEEIEQKLSSLNQEFDALMLLVPQPARSDVPVGKDDSENVVLRIWGSVPKFNFKFKDHAELGKLHNIIDTTRGVKLAGSRSYVLVGDGALLEQAVLRYTYDKFVKKGYTPLSIPVLVTEAAMYGTGYFPTGREQAYYVEKDQLALVGTSEVSLTSFHSGEILAKDELPKRFFAMSSCFRREAGTYGKDTQGLYRVHQFQKIEQVVIAPADSSISEVLHEELLSNAEELMQDLNLPYRVVYVCTGDLGQGQLRKHDIEAWMPSRNAYSETHSCSTFHDFQARRLKLRYKDEGDGGDKGQKTQFCYTLNNTAVATPRILIPILENYQNEDGSITIPECLRPYMNGRTKIG